MWFNTSSIDNVLGRILDDSTLSNVISPVRIKPDNIYDEKIKKITYKPNNKSKFGLDQKKLKIHPSSSLI